MIGNEISEVFIIQANPDYYKVITPEKYFPEQSVIVENKMLIRLVGKLKNSKGAVLKLMSIQPQQSQSVKVHVEEGEKLEFIPLNPSFESFILKIGQKSYEIPEKSK